MPISDKTRKMLWARSGNRCALCKNELAQSNNSDNSRVIIGQECHIVSSKPSGPRGEVIEEFDYDVYDNLILLCANDHKRIDELVEVYTKDHISDIKAGHERWVKETLEKDILSFTNDRNNIKALRRILCGKELIDIVNGAMSFSFEHVDVESVAEAELIGRLGDLLRDSGDCFDLMSSTDIAKFGISLNQEIQNINDIGFSVFGLRRTVNLRYGNGQVMNNWHDGTVIVVKSDNPGIIGDFLIAEFPKKISFQ